MTTMTVGSAASLPARNGWTVSDLFASARQSWARRRTRSILSDLDDHTLQDIGLNPAEFRARSRTVDWVVQSNRGTARLVFIGR